VDSESFSIGYNAEYFLVAYQPPLQTPIWYHII